MKKILWSLLALVLAATLAAVLKDAWDTATFFREKGREGAVRIGDKYNASRWSEPLPIKKIHAYTAVLSPDHELVVETDQLLADGDQRFVRFLTRDLAEQARKQALRPLDGAIRLRAQTDGTPVRLADTDLFDRAVDYAMGPPAAGTYVRPKPVAEKAPDRTAPTVPFVWAGAQDGTFEIIWNNSRWSEWLIVGLWLFAIKVAVLQAWASPLNVSRPVGSARKDFVHPSLRKIEASARAEPSQKLTYTPKGEDHDYIGIAKPVPPVTPEAPAAAAGVPAPAENPPPPPPRQTVALPTSGAPKPPVSNEPYSTATTAAPFVPADAADVSLKLKRKPRPATGDAPPPEKPPAAE